MTLLSRILYPEQDTMEISLTFQSLSGMKETMTLPVKPSFRADDGKHRFFILS